MAAAVDAVSSDLSVSDATTHTSNMPSGTGGILVVSLGCERESTAITFPGGWTTVVDESPGEAARIKVAYKTDAAESSIEITTAANCETIMRAWRISGGDVSAVEGAGASSAGDAAGNPPNVNITGGPKSGVVLVGMALDGGGGTVSAFPYAGNNLSTDTGGGATSTTGGFADGTFSSVSAVDPGTFTNPITEWAVFTVVVPDSAGGGFVPTPRGGDGGMNDLKGGMQ